MANHLPRHATDFAALFARVEHTLRRNGYARKDRSRSVVDWALFAKELGQTFFDTIRTGRKAKTLIGEPPRIYHRDKGFLPEVQIPIADVVELFLRGVCQVRNNIVHGEKYVEDGSKRDDDLVQGANFVLEQAINRHPALKDIERFRRKRAERVEL
jgi:hypothetical protein